MNLKKIFNKLDIILKINYDKLICERKVISMKKFLLFFMAILLIFGIEVNSNYLLSENIAGAIKWKFTASSDIYYSSPAIGKDGTIYVGSRDGNLYAIKPNGEKKWTFKTGEGIYSTPSIGEDGTIYIASYDSKFYAINPDGTKKWEFKTGDKVYATPAIGKDGTIYVGSIDGKLYAISSDGKEKWEFATDDEILASPVVDQNGIIYVASEDGELYALYPDGKEKWRVTSWNPYSASPILDLNGNVYFSSSEGILYKFSSSREQIWKFNTNQFIEQAPVIDRNGIVYIGTQDGTFFAINTDGSLKWKFDVKRPIDASSIVDSNGIIYISHRYGYLYALNPDGTKKWEINLGGELSSSPVIGEDGILYICSGNNLYAIYTGSKGLENSAWPMFQHDPQHTGRIDETSTSLGESIYANPENPQNAIELNSNSIKNPEETIINIKAKNSVYIEPSLNVDSEDIGKQAKLLMYAYIPSMNLLYQFPVITETLQSIQKFSNFSQKLDFSNLHNFKFYIYYGYQIGDLIKYNDYCVIVE